jgi:hypothetical protein
LNQAAILIAGALVLVRQRKGDRAMPQIVEDEAEDIHE